MNAITVAPLEVGSQTYRYTGCTARTVYSIRNGGRIRLTVRRLEPRGKLVEMGRGYRPRRRMVEVERTYLVHGAMVWEGDEDLWLLHAFRVRKDGTPYGQTQFLSPAQLHQVVRVEVEP